MRSGSGSVTTRPGACGNEASAPFYQLPTETVIIDPPEQRVTPPRTVAVLCPRFHQREQAEPGDTGRAPEQLVQCGICWSVARVIKECGSGITDQRPKFLALFADPKISQIVVEHKDWASHFVVAYLQTLLRMQGREVVVVHPADTVTDTLMGDFVAIITSFCARLCVCRRAKRTTEQVLAALQQNGSASSESKVRQGQEETPTEAQKQAHADSCSDAYPTACSQSRKTGGVR
jgi:putative resolvase